MTHFIRVIVLLELKNCGFMVGIFERLIKWPAVNGKNAVQPESSRMSFQFFSFQFVHGHDVKIELFAADIN